ncbi:type 2 lanthipeptide synthetase LanM family protein [Actinophytocola sp.]|uniref:type 2 lanthipeptide synthetase LanM family protein n=1 Tax=Actinophytocola sp. TaxID=1872138 RepID=UPI002ED293B1
MTAIGDGEQFERSATAFLNPATADLATALAITGLTPTEQKAVHAGAMAALHDSVLRKISRVLVLELNAARLTGSLTATDSADRWAEFVDRTCVPGYWDTLGTRYPTMLARLRTVVANRVAAAVEFATRFVGDREVLGIGELTGAEFGAGDSHRGGRTVVLVRGTDGAAVYKPRSVAVDRALANLLAAVVPDEDDPVRVPAVHVRDGYGWAEHVAHRYCGSEAELTRFYRNLGRWLAITRLVGGTDLHQENLIAAGPVPVVVDCETLFTPRQPAPPSGYGEATDAAHAMVAGSVLGTGLLPGRGLVLGWRGIDTSAIGSLPGQQPVPDVPVIVGAGTDTAHIGFAKGFRAPTANHPCAEPVLGKYWQHVVSAFTEQTARLRAEDRAGRLADLLAPFADVPVRAVVRATETYAELSRMLWHPASLHDEASAVARAEDLLARHAGNAPDAPDAPDVIAAEVAELLTGDIPFFTTTPATGVLTGPRGTRWGRAGDLLSLELDRWRATDPDVDRRVIQAALVSAYLNEGWLPDEVRRLPSTVDGQDLDRRRRAHALGIVEQIVSTAVLGADGTASWVASVLNPTGWSVQALSADLYSGVGGVAVLLAAYLREQAAGRADEVPGLRALLAAAMRTLTLAEDRWRADVAAGVPLRPEPPGGYVGIGSRITAWLLLRRFGAVGDEAVERARWLAGQVARAVVDDTAYDVLVGRAGVIVPLLRLAELTGDGDLVRHAGMIGNQLIAEGEPRGETMCWPNEQFPEGIGGFAHGATGIGWALTRLAAVTGDPAHADAARAAFAYEETLYSPELGGWLDLREREHVGGAWCHGAGGIGLAALDLLPFDESWRAVATRAARSAWTHGTGWNHTLCHGDLGVWELVRAVPDVVGVDVDAHIVAALDEFGVVTGMAREAFSPALLPGAGGVAYQLLRLHPDSDLPSVLLPDPGPAHDR